MPNKRIWIIFFSTTLTIIFILAIVSLYNAKESERKLALRKDQELTGKALELAQKEGTISDLSRQKKEAEEQLAAKVSEYETRIQNYEKEIESSKTKIETLVKENESITSESDAKNRKIADLTKKIDAIESDKSELLDKIKKLETEKATAEQNASAAATAEKSAGAVAEKRAEETAPRLEPGSDTVQLGTIIVQKSTGHVAEVQQVNPIYGFIVVNAGSKDGLSKDSPINIIRGNQIIGKAIVKQVRDNVSAATLLPEWSKDEVKVGDIISNFPKKTLLSRHQ